MISPPHYGEQKTCRGLIAMILVFAVCTTATGVSPDHDLNADASMATSESIREVNNSEPLRIGKCKWLVLGVSNPNHSVVVKVGNERQTVIQAQSDPVDQAVHTVPLQMQYDSKNAESSVCITVTPQATGRPVQAVLSAFLGPIAEFDGVVLLPELSIGPTEHASIEMTIEHPDEIIAKFQVTERFKVNSDITTEYLVRASTYRPGDRSALKQSIQETYLNGALRLHETYRSGKLLTGVYYAPKGDTLSHVVDGNGSITRCYPNGQIEFLQTMLEGVSHGTHQFFYRAGELRASQKWNHGAVEGAFVVYHRNGKIKLAGQFDKGKMDGEWMLYDEAGNIIAKATFRDDVPIAGKADIIWDAMTQ